MWLFESESGAYLCIESPYSAPVWFKKEDSAKAPALFLSHALSLNLYLILPASTLTYHYTFTYQASCQALS